MIFIYLGAALFVVLIMIILIYLFYFRWSVSIPDYMAARHYRFGKPSTQETISGKRVIVIPTIDLLVMIDKRIQKSTLENISILTKERQQMSLSLTLIWKPENAAMTIENIRPEDIEPTFFKIAESVIKNESSKMTVDEILENRNLLAKNLNGILSETTDKWGITVSSVNISNLVVKNESFMRNMALPKEIELERKTQIAQLEKELAVELKTIEKNRDSELHKLEVEKTVGIKKEEVTTLIEQAQKVREQMICELQEKVEKIKSDILLIQQNTISAYEAKRIKDSILAETEGLREKIEIINSCSQNALGFEMIKILPELYKNLKIGDVTLFENNSSETGKFDLYSNIVGSVMPMIKKFNTGMNTAKSSLEPQNVETN